MSAHVRFSGDPWKAGEATDRQTQAENGDGGGMTTGWEMIDLGDG
jgi:hypothetical protein